MDRVQQSQWHYIEDSCQHKHSKPSEYAQFQHPERRIFSRQRRKISATLPRFNSFNTDQKDWNAEKLGRGRWRPASGIKWGSLKTLIGNILRKFKILLIVLVLIPLTTILWTKTSQYRSESVKQMILSDSWCRHDCPLQASVLFRRWISFRYNTGSKPGRWRYGMERPS